MTEDEIFDHLCRLLPAPFETVLLRAKVPAEFVSAASAPQATRAGEVLRWMRQSPAHTERVREIVAGMLDGAGQGPTDLTTKSPKRDGREPESARDAAHGTDDRLDELYQQRDEARDAGTADRVRALNEEILRIKREKRAGGQLEAGDVLGRDDNGRYKLVELIGKGGFATVWKAYDRAARRFVAVKVLHAEHARDESRRERFFRGAREMAALRHPNIVQVFEPHADDHGWHYFVMELIEGEDLDAAVRGGRVTAEQGLALVLEVADALTHAHGRGLVHRDVAPPNILVDRAGHAHLGDFDLVRADDSVGGTRTSMLGRFIYAAPELMSRPQDADARTDVYALGMTLAFVYAGKPLPLDALKRQDAFVASLPCSEAVRDAVERAIRDEMDERFQSVAAFAQALRASTATADPRLADQAPRVTMDQRPDVAAVVSATPPAQPKPGDVWSEPTTGLTLVWIPPGEFLMGSSICNGEPGYDPEAYDDETPPRRVKISQGFWLGKHPVTNEQYGRFLAKGGRVPDYWRNRRFNGPQQPVVGVTFDDALAYCAWATEQVGLTGDIPFHLPTEAEWEYAARGEAGRRYPWGDAPPTPERAVWGLPGDRGAAAPIGQRPRGATPLGVHDMAVNVWEWCLDGWRDRYPSLSTVELDSCFPAPRAALRVARGGSWYGEARGLRCATRYRDIPGNRLQFQGFRVGCRRFHQYLTE